MLKISSGSSQLRLVAGRNGTFHALKNQIPIPVNPNPLLRKEGREYISVSFYVLANAMGEQLRVCMEGSEKSAIRGAEIGGAKMGTNRRWLQRMALVLSLTLCTSLLMGCSKKDAAEGTGTASAGGMQTGGTSSGVQAGKTK